MWKFQLSDKLIKYSNYQYQVSFKLIISEVNVPDKFYNKTIVDIDNSASWYPNSKLQSQSKWLT